MTREDQKGLHKRKTTHTLDDNDAMWWLRPRAVLALDGEERVTIAGCGIQSVNKAATKAENKSEKETFWFSPLGGVLGAEALAAVSQLSGIEAAASAPTLLLLLNCCKFRRGTKTPLDCEAAFFNARSASAAATVAVTEDVE